MRGPSCFDKRQEPDNYHISNEMHSQKAIQRSTHLIMFALCPNRVKQARRCAIRSGNTYPVNCCMMFTPAHRHILRRFPNGPPCMSSAYQKGPGGTIISTPASRRGVISKRGHLQHFLARATLLSPLASQPRPSGPWSRDPRVGRVCERLLRFDRARRASAGNREARRLGATVEKQRRPENLKSTVSFEKPEDAVVILNRWAGAIVRVRSRTTVRNLASKPLRMPPQKQTQIINRHRRKSKTRTITKPMIVIAEFKQTSVPRTRPSHVSDWYTGIDEELNPLP